jgi:3-oxoacyl-[acyl-carrier protein] reductase/meso-butanediol dehydrogenase/(S,S)-butanediol dehydrogenase/diacetyl reductase
MAEQTGEPWCGGLRGKVALITGAGGYNGLGRQIALELARHGANLIVTDIAAPPVASQNAAEWRGISSLAEEIEALGARALPIVSDVTDPVSADAVLKQAVETFGGVDFLVNNAGAPVGNDRVHVVDLPVEAWNKVLQVNLNGTFLMSQAVARHMIARGKGGAIVNISSIASREAAPKFAAYAVSKAGINVLSRIMAMELAPHQIRVNAIIVGLNTTARLGDMPQSESWPDFVKGYVPLGYAGDGSQIASMCTFLLSERGQWITGQDLGVDGGSTWR